MGISSDTSKLLILCGVLVFVCIICIYGIIVNKGKTIKHNKNKNNKKGILNKLNGAESIQSSILFSSNNQKIETLFNRSKNPWHMKVGTFQFIRYIGLIFFIVVALLIFGITGNETFTLLAVAFAVICFIYPVYYYKALGDEREAEWNKMYEFVWVLKHNLMLYDPAQAYINTKLYIAEHAPHDTEIIQGFDDFYNYWNDNELDPYIIKYYDFSVPREITQIVFNMKQTGDFPEDALNSLRTFIINAQDLTVEKTLSGVSGKATIFSLPFMMISVIIGLMVPLLMQVVSML